MSVFHKDTAKETAEALSRQLKYVYNLFVSHPKENHMTYLEHFCHAIHLSYHMCYGSACLMVHAFFPFVCNTKGSRIITKLYIESQKKSLSQDDDVKEV